MHGIVHKIRKDDHDQDDIMYMNEETSGIGDAVGLPIHRCNMLR